MCLLVLAWQAHRRYRLVLAANRDEFHARPTAALAHWQDSPPITGGRDLKSGGTWLAVSGARFGALTNFSERQSSPPASPSRGELIPGFLSDERTPQAYADTLETRAGRYCGFSLLLGDERSLTYASNRAQPFARTLTPGVYGLSNHLLDTPWPKLARVRRALQDWLAADARGGAGALLAALADRTPAQASQLPATARGGEWDRVLSSPFVQHPEYGTRSSTVLTLGHDGHGEIVERRYDATGALTGETALALS